MRHLEPHTCAAAFILESTIGAGRLLGAIASSGPESNAYQGELLGLLAINLILQSVNTVNPILMGNITIHSNFMGAIRKIQDIPVSRLPAKTKHADILKILLTYDGPSAITTQYQHIAAHQDDTTSLEQLSQPALLNCECDHMAKSHLLRHLHNPQDRPLPWEALHVTIQRVKLTTASGPTIQHHVGQQLAWQFFNNKHIHHVSLTLQSVPKLFQLWAAKHIAQVAGTMSYL